MISLRYRSTPTIWRGGGAPSQLTAKRLGHANYRCPSHSKDRIGITKEEAYERRGDIIAEKQRDSSASAATQR